MGAKIILTVMVVMATASSPHISDRNQDEAGVFFTIDSNECFNRGVVQFGYYDEAAGNVTVTETKSISYGTHVYRVAEHPIKGRTYVCVILDTPWEAIVKAQ